MTPAEEQAIRDRAAAAARALAGQPTDDYLCPNCVTPWKCNGPHIPDPERDDGFDVFLGTALDDVTALLAELDRLREECGYLEEQLRQCREGPWG